MSTPLPGLSGLDKAGLQAAYFAELGKPAGDQTTDELREALKTHRAAAPDPQAPIEPAAPVAGEDEVVAHHAEYGERPFTRIAWDILRDREGNRDGWEVKPEKPELVK